MVLHTWGQNLGQHVHVHCVVTDGALSPDGGCWLTPPRRGFLFPTAALSKVFHGKYLDLLTDAHRSGELRMPGNEGLDDTRAFECLKASLQMRDVEERWESLESRLEVVSGKDVLKDLREQLSVRYSISLTDFRIIDEFREDEVPEDLARFLAALDEFRVN